MSHNVTAFPGRCHTMSRKKSCISASFFGYFTRKLLVYLQIFELIEMKRPMLLLVGVGLLLACSETNRNYVYKEATCFGYEDFLERKELKGSVWEADSSLLLPTKLQMYDTLLAVLTPQEDKILHLVDVNSGKRVASQLSIGQGPNEVLYPGLVNTREEIRLADLMASAVWTCGMQDFLQGNMTNARKTPLARRTTGEIQMLGNHYIAPSYRDDFLFYVFDEDGSVVDSIGEYPEWKEAVTPMEKRAMYEFAFTTNARDRIAVCYNWVSLIDVLDDKGHLCRRLQGPQYFTSLFKEERDGRVVIAMSVKDNRWDAYVAPAPWGDGFGVLYSGQSEYAPDYEAGSRDLLSFGWDGTLRTHYHLDKSIQTFTVDEANRKVYAVCGQPDVHLEVFDY